MEYTIILVIFQIYIYIDIKNNKHTYMYIRILKKNNHGNSKTHVDMVPTMMSTWVPDFEFQNLNSNV